MAVVKAFRGVRYDLRQVGSLDKVVTQPYDRIRYGLQERYYALSPYNIVRIVKRAEGKEGGAGDIYEQAREVYQQWLAEGVLKRDAEPALYVYHQSFSLPDGARLTRRGFVGALRLAPFEEGIVLPHERTLSGPKADRLRLLRATKVNFGHVFMLYPDEGSRVQGILERAIEGRAPDMVARELYEEDVLHEMWVVSDPEVIAAVEEEMAPKRHMIIADGHHRYETALNYLAEQLERYPDAPVDAAFRYRMTTFVSMDDPGLVIFPTHREVYGLVDLDVDALLREAEGDFEVVPVEGQEACFRVMRERVAEHAFGLFDGERWFVLVLRDEERLGERIGGDRAWAWKTLDVTILQALLLEGLLGIDEERLERHVRYHRDVQLAVEHVRSGEGDLLFCLNPTLISQVRACAEQGERMPQKSTDFYPKVITGLVMMSVHEDERI